MCAAATTPEAVQNFNALSRSPVAPSGAVENHWHVSVRHIPLHPPGDLVIVTNPPSRFIHAEGPSQILNLPTTQDKARVVVRLMLQGFVKGLGIPGTPRFAPWSWGMAEADEELRVAVEEELARVKVKEGLRTVRKATTEEMGIIQEEWTRFVGSLMQATGRSRNQG